MLFKDWQHMVKNKRSYTFGNEKDPDYQKRFDAIVEWRALRLYNTHRYDHNFDGWKSYLCDASPFFAERLLFKEFPVRLPREKVLNCYIVAASQSGKTELLKLLAHSIIKQGKEALICIEPAGDASRQIALWPECKDRLIYVDLSLDLSRAPTVNPFEIYGIKAEDTSPAALDVKTVVAQQLLTAFQEVLGTGAGAELSKNMRTIILPCLMVLLDWPGATIRDLRRFMDDTLNRRLVEFAETRHHYEDVPEFFTHDFHSKHYKDTKNAVQAKLQSLFASGKFSRLTCGPSTFTLEKAIEERKIIIFNLAEGSVGEQERLGIRAAHRRTPTGDCRASRKAKGACAHTGHHRRISQFHYAQYGEDHYPGFQIQITPSHGTTADWPRHHKGDTRRHLERECTDRRKKRPDVPRPRRLDAQRLARGHQGLRPWGLHRTSLRRSAALIPHPQTPLGL